MPVGDILRYAFLTLVLLVLLVFGMKWLGKQRTEKEIVAELRTLTGPSSSFDQFNAEDTRKTLFRTLYQIHRADSELDIPPDEIFDIVFKVPKDDNFLGGTDPSRDNNRDPGQRLVRNSLIANYEKGSRLGIFSDTVSLDALRKGEAPQIHSGEHVGRWVELHPIIDPKISPGIEKIVPNLVVGPPAPKEQPATPTAFDIARAKQLAGALDLANHLEREAFNRIVEHYDQLASGEAPGTDPAQKAPE